MQLRFRTAGKSDMGLVRKNNEDNFRISSDLTVSPMRWTDDEERTLSPAGALLVVADGMGGANAGEVASQIAVDTVDELFNPASISEIDLGSPGEVNDFLRTAVIVADARIKAAATNRPDTRGMGTTIVMAWLLDGLLYVAWCGDSRAYIFNPATGLRRLTKDHSYVQALVDMGKLSEEEAFDFPQSNIITRCLCDSNVVAEADVLPRPYRVVEGDIVLLCTDGLCGLLRDNEIETLIAKGSGTAARVQTLIGAALGAGGSDNVTLAMLEVLPDSSSASAPHTAEIYPSESTPVEATAMEATPMEATPMEPEPTEATPEKAAPSDGTGKRSLWPFILGGVALGAVIAWGAYRYLGDKTDSEPEATSAPVTAPLTTPRTESPAPAKEAAKPKPKAQATQPEKNTPKETAAKEESDEEAAKPAAKEGAKTPAAKEPDTEVPDIFE